MQKNKIRELLTKPQPMRTYYKSERTEPIMTTIITFNELLKRIKNMEEDATLDVWNPRHGTWSRIIRVPDLDNITIVIKETWAGSTVRAASYIPEDEADYEFVESVAEILKEFGIIVDDNQIEIDSEEE